MDHQTWIRQHYIIGTDFERYFMSSNVDFTKSDKFDCLKYYMNNIFYTNAPFYDLFFKIQQLNYAVCKIKNAYRFKKARLYNTDDLYMNPISPTDKNVVVLLQNNTKYVFHIRELIQSINNSLSNCSYFFSEPIVCKNPYTNIPFTKSALYNIYFAIRESTYLMPILLHQYFLSNFNYSDFSNNNEEMINNEYLKSYVENHCLENIHKQVKEMFVTYDIKLYVHRRFPEDILYNIMKPYLKLYFISTYSMNYYKKHVANELLKVKLKKFMKYNPTFGRQKIKFYSENIFQKVKKIKYYFDDTVIPFTDDFEKTIDITSFRSSHLAEIKNGSSNIISVFPQLHNEESDSSNESIMNFANTHNDNNELNSEENTERNTNTQYELNEEIKEDDNESEYNENQIFIRQNESIIEMNEYDWEEKEDIDSV